MLGATCITLLCLMFTWPTLQYPVSTALPTRFKPAEDCLEIDLQEVEKLRSPMLDKIANNSIYHFGLKEDDWIRLKALENQLPSDSPLKDKLWHSFRIVLAAIEIAHKNQNVTEIKDESNYRQADGSVYPSGNRQVITLSPVRLKEQSKNNSDNSIHNVMIEDNIILSEDGSGSSTRSTTSEGLLRKFTDTMSKNDFKITATEEQNDRLKTPLTFEYNSNALLKNTVLTEIESTVTAMNSDTTKEQFTDYVTTETPNLTTLNEVQYENSHVSSEIWLTKLPRESSIYQDVMQYSLNLPHKTEHVTVNSEDNDFTENTSTNVSTTTEDTKYKSIPMLHKNTSDYTTTAVRNLVSPVNTSPLITSVNDEMSDFDTTTFSTMIPYATNKQDHTNGDDSITVTMKPEEPDKYQSSVNTIYTEEFKTVHNYTDTTTVPLIENLTRSVTSSESAQEKSVLANTEVSNKEDNSSQMWPVSTDLVAFSNDYTLQDSTDYTDRVVTESRFYFRDNLDTLDKHTPTSDEVSKLLDGLGSTQNEIASFATSTIRDGILSIKSDNLTIKTFENTVTEIDIPTTGENSLDTENINTITDFNTDSFIEIFNERVSKASTPFAQDLHKFTFNTFPENSTIKKDEINIYGNTESEAFNTTTLYDTSSTVRELFISQNLSIEAGDNAVSNHNSHILMDGFQTDYNMTTSELLSPYSSEVTKARPHTAETESSVSDNISLTEPIPYSVQDIADITTYSPHSSSSLNKTYNIFETTEEKSTTPERSTVPYNKPNDEREEDITTNYNPYIYTTAETQVDISGYSGINFDVSSTLDVTKEADKTTVNTIQVNQDDVITEHTKFQTFTESYTEVVKYVIGNATVPLISHQEEGNIESTASNNETPTAINTYTSNDMGSITSQSSLLNDITRPNSSEYIVLPNVHSDTENVVQDTITVKAETTTESSFILTSVDDTKLDANEITSYVTKTESDVVTNKLPESESVTHANVVLSDELHTEHNTIKQVTWPVSASDTTATGSIRNTATMTPYYFTDIGNYNKVPNNKHVSQSSDVTTEVQCKGAPSVMFCAPQGTEKTSTVSTSDQDSPSISQLTTSMDFSQKNTTNESKIHNYFIKLPELVNWNTKPIHNISNVSIAPSGSLVKPDAYSSTQKCISSSPCLKIYHNEFIPRNARPAVSEVNYRLSSNSQQESQSNVNELMWWYKMRKLRKKPDSEYNLLKYFNKK